MTTARADGVGDQQRNVQQAQDQLDSIGNQIDQLGADYDAALDQKATLDAQVAESQAKVDQQQAQLDALQGQLTQIALSKYTSGATTELSPLFTDAGSYSDAQQRDELNRLTLDNGAGDVDQMSALATDLAKEKAKLEHKQQQVANLVSGLADKKSRAETLQTQYTAKLAEAKAKYGEALVAEQTKRAQEQIARAQAIAQQQAAKDAAARKVAQDAQNAAAAAPAASARVAPAAAPSRGGGAAPAPVQAPAADPTPTDNSSTAPADTGGSSAGGGSGGGGPPPPSSKAGIAVAASYSQLGVPYVFAAASPGVAFDCSGLTLWAWGRAGVSLPHFAASQYSGTPHVTQAEIQPGDLIFYHEPIGHVAIYVGGGQLIHAPRTGDVVKLSPVNWGSVVGISRPG